MAGPEIRPSTASDRIARAAELSGKLLVIAAAVLAGLLLFWTLRGILVPLFLALLITTQLLPVVTWLRNKGLPPALAVTVTVLGGLLAVAAMVGLVAGQIVGESEQLGDTLSSGTDDVAAWIATNSGPFELSTEEVRSQADELVTNLTENPAAAANGVLGGLSTALGILAGSVLTFAFVVYMLSDAGRGVRWFLGQLGEPGRERWSRGLNAAWNTLGNYIRGVATVAAFDAILIGAVLFLLGVPLAGALTAMIFLLAFIPIIGAWASGIIATLVALAGAGAVPALVVAATSLAVQQLESVVLAPLVYQRAVRVHPMITLAAVTTGALVGGIIGAFVAVPLVAVLWAVSREWRLPAG